MFFVQSSDAIFCFTFVLEYLSLHLFGHSFNFDSFFFRDPICVHSKIVSVAKLKWNV